VRSAFAAMLAAAIGAGVVMPFAGIHLVALALWPVRSAVERLAGIASDDDSDPFDEIAARVYLGLACGVSVFATVLFTSRMWPALLRPAWPAAIVPGAAAAVAAALMPVGPTAVLAMIAGGVAGIVGAGIAGAIWG